MQDLHVLTHKEELDQERLAGKIVVVLDVLFATSTIIAALQHGALEVIPVLDEAVARAEAAKQPAGGYVLAGEYNAIVPAGFASFAPKALLRENLVGKQLIYATTNGTVALCQSVGAAYVYAAALLNGAAVAEHVRRCWQDQTVLILCAGSRGSLNLEDLYGAGYLVDCLTQPLENRWRLSDAALVAHSLFRQREARECLLRSCVGRMMQQVGLEEEVHFAARLNVYPIVPVLVDGCLRV